MRFSKARVRGLGHPLWLNGRRVRGPVRLTHAPAAAGSYYVGPTPVGEYTMNPNSPMGAYVQYPVRGLGQDHGIPAASVGLAIIGAAILGTAGWYAGKAMAPTAASADSYKWAGAITNIVAPGLGLGIVGIVALSGRGSSAGV